jgi:HAD superfamily hydrolase (TIGR01509 family)
MEHLNLDKYDGFIFDLDGTLADSMPAHFHAWTVALQRLTGEPSRFTEEQFYAMGGVPARGIVTWLNAEMGYNLPIEETAEEKESLYVQFLDEIQPIAPVIDLVKRLGLNRKLAIASGGFTEIVRRTALHIGVLDYFKVLVGSDQVSMGKPSPEIFLRAASLLEVKPSRCLVFEDGEPGFAAAKAAGMEYIDVKPYYCQGRSWYTAKQPSSSSL